MKGLGVSLLVALLLVLLAIEDTVSVSRSIDPSYNWPSSVRVLLAFFFFACTEKDDDRGSEENYQEFEESLQQEERHPQRYYAFSRMDASRN